MVEVHTGEAEFDGDVVREVAVHVAARGCAAAAGSKVVVSSTVCDLTAESGLDYEDRGLHELNGIPRARHRFAVQ